MNASKTNNDPTFRIYPVEQGVAIIRAIAEHRWPMHLNEAFALRDQFGWKKRMASSVSIPPIAP